MRSRLARYAPSARGAVLPALAVIVVLLSILPASGRMDRPHCYLETFRRAPASPRNFFGHTLRMHVSAVLSSFSSARGFAHAAGFGVTLSTFLIDNTIDVFEPT